MASRSKRKEKKKRVRTGPKPFEFPMDPRLLEEISEARSLWYESKEEILHELRRGRDKAARLRWIRSRMAFDLREIERLAITLHYFDGLTYRQAAAVLGVSPSSVCRAARKGVKKLRRAVEGPEPGEE